MTVHSLRVSPVPVEEQDDWPLVGSGLPPRVVNSLSRGGIERLGEARRLPEEKLLTFRGMGRDSLMRLRHFWDLGRDLAGGSLAYPDLEALLRTFLSDGEFHFLSLRYGLTRSRPGGSRNFHTLQDIGRQEHCTRERARQVLDHSLRLLRCHFPCACLRAAPRELEERLRLLNDSAAMAELDEDAQIRTLFGSLTPSASLYLLSDILPDLPLTIRQTWVSRYREGELGQVRTDALEALRCAPAALTPQDLTRALPRPAERSPTSRYKIACLLLRDAQEAGLLRDGRVFSRPRHLAALLEAHTPPPPLDIHYRNLTQSLNQELEPESQVGVTTVLKMLNQDPRFKRITPGRYARASSADRPA